MSWITISNEVVKDFRGKPIQSTRLDDNMETVYKTIRCSGKDCDFTATNIKVIQDHLDDKHEDEVDDLKIKFRPETTELTASYLILNILLAFNNAARDNPLLAIRKANDGFHAGEAWRRAWNAKGKAGQDIKLKKEQYDWLHQLLERKLPRPKEKEDAGEAQTVLMHLYGLNEDKVKQALTTLPDRRRIESEDELYPDNHSGKVEEVAQDNSHLHEIVAASKGK